MSPDKTNRSNPADIDTPENRLWTIPNLLCFIRMAGSVILLGAAYIDRPRLFVWLYLFLAMTDWIDGKIAIALNQQSVLGARLDSWADASLYTALFLGSIMLYQNELIQEIKWVVPAVATYIFSVLFCLYKFHHWPSYHTKLAKISWLMIMIGAVSFLYGLSVWPLRLAMISVTITNLETSLITLFAQKWRTDVLSLYSLLKNSANPKE